MWKNREIIFRVYEYIKYNVDYLTSFEEINHPDSSITIRISGEHHNLLTKRIRWQRTSSRDQPANNLGCSIFHVETKKIMKIKTSTWRRNENKSSTKERKESFTMWEKTKRPEAIWTRSSCLKFFQIEELKSNDEELEEQGKGDFFRRNNLDYEGKKKKEIKRSKYLRRRKGTKTIMQ